MKRTTSIKLKAAFLLAVFSLNTLIGFACAVGMDMGFKAKHHQEEKGTAPVVHIHADGKRHVHDNRQESPVHEQVLVVNEVRKSQVIHDKDGKRENHQPKKHTGGHHNFQRGKGTPEATVHVHKDGKHHVHDAKKENHPVVKPQHKEAEKLLNDQKSNKNDCCTDEAVAFEQLDKSIPQSIKIVHPIFFVFVGTYYDIHLLPFEDVVKDIKQFVRSYHPPIQDIRIAIQSFQI